MKKPENNQNKEEKSYIKVDSFEVLRAQCVGNNNAVLFNMALNGVTIYGCRVVEGKNGDFISFPQSKGKDGKYYHVAYAYISNEDQKKILESVEAKLNS